LSTSRGHNQQRERFDLSLALVVCAAEDDGLQSEIPQFRIAALTIATADITSIEK
jgi:hypothetical protein